MFVVMNKLYISLLLFEASSSCDQLYTCYYRHVESPMDKVHARVHTQLASKWGSDQHLNNVLMLALFFQKGAIGRVSEKDRYSQTQTLTQIEYCLWVSCPDPSHLRRSVPLDTILGTTAHAHFHGIYSIYIGTLLSIKTAFLARLLYYVSFDWGLRFGTCS